MGYGVSIARAGGQGLAKCRNLVEAGGGVARGGRASTSYVTWYIRVPVTPLVYTVRVVCTCSTGYYFYKYTLKDRYVLPASDVFFTPSGFLEIIHVSRFYGNATVTVLRCKDATLPALRAQR